MNSFSGRNAHHPVVKTAIPASDKTTFFALPELPLLVFICPPPQKDAGQACPALGRSFSEFLQRRGAKIGVEALAVDGNRGELAQIRSRRNFIVLIAFVSLQLSELHAL